MKNKSASLLVVSLGKAPIAGFPHLGLVDRWEMAGNFHDSDSDLINESTAIFYQIHLKPAAALLTLRSDTIAFLLPNYCYNISYIPKAGHFIGKQAQNLKGSWASSSIPGLKFTE